MKKIIKRLNFKYRYDTIQMFAKRIWEEILLSSIENLKDLIIYQSQNNENISVEVLYNEEDFWLTQKSMSKLFNVAENNITYHLQNIFLCTVPLDTATLRLLGRENRILSVFLQIKKLKSRLS